MFYNIVSSVFYHVDNGEILLQIIGDRTGKEDRNNIVPLSLVQ